MSGSEEDGLLYYSKIYEEIDFPFFPLGDNSGRSSSCSDKTCSKSALMCPLKLRCSSSKRAVRGTELLKKLL